MKSYQATELRYRLRHFIRRRGKGVIEAIVGFLISVSGVFLWLAPDGQRLDLWVLQHFFSIRGERGAPPDVVIAAIDDETYQHLQVSTRWPFPRRFEAAALERVVRASPKVLIIDLKFPKEENDPVADEGIERALRAGPTSIWSGEMSTERITNRSDNPKASIVLPSDERFQKAARIKLPMWLFTAHGLMFQITVNEKDEGTIYERVPIARPLVELGRYRLVSPGPRDFINFYGPKATIKRVPLYSILDATDEELSQHFKDKVVLFGFQSVGRGRGQLDKDEYNVPVSEDSMFGVEIQANVAGNLLDRSWLKRYPVTTELSAIYIAGLIIAVLGVKLTPEKAIPLVVALLASISVGAYLWFSRFDRWIPGVAVLWLVGLVTVAGSALYHYVLIKRFRKFVKRTFNFDFEGEN